jgi:hypothetical protein
MTFCLSLINGHKSNSKVKRREMYVQAPFIAHRISTEETTTLGKFGPPCGGQLQAVLWP